MPAVLRGPEVWARARAELEGLPGGALNIAHEAVDRHAAGAARDRVAVRFLPRLGPPQELTYAQLRRRADRFACALRDLGLERGDCVATLLGPRPELHVAAHGTFKHGGLFAPISAGLDPAAVAAQLELAEARVVVTTPGLHARAIAPARGGLPWLRHVLLAGEPEEVARVPGALDLRALLARARGGHHAARTAPEELALVHLERSPSGAAAGALHVHDAVVAHHATAGSALDLRAGDVLWCAVDLASVPGLAYGVIGALTRAATCLITEELEPAAATRLLAGERVAVWLGAPAALGPGPPPSLPALRRVVRGWGAGGDPRVLGRPVVDLLWQAETGGAVVVGAGDPAGAWSGAAVPGLEAEVVRREGDGVVLLAPGRAGELALRAGWPSMLRGYLRDEERLHRRFCAGWYLTGHPARRGDDGRLRLLGADPVGGGP